MIGDDKKNSITWIAIAALALSPLIFWVAIKSLSDRFASPATTLTSIGQMFGLVGMTLFALTLVLSTRHPLLDRWFGGINRAYTAHHTFGAIAFSLLLFHPLALALKYALFSTSAAARFLLSTDTEILFGIIALLSLMLFLVLTFFISFAYDKWKLTHKFLAASFLFAALHTLLIESDTTEWNVLYVYMAAYIAIGVVAICYRTLFSNFLVHRTEYIVDEVQELGNRTVCITMLPAFKPLTHKAGQFIFVSFQNDVVGKEWHPFSIASAPHEPRITIIVKTLGDHTGKLKLLPQGTVAQVEGPFGSFSYDHGKEKNQLWIAGGVGITPFLSMAKDLRDPAYTVKLYYCTKEKGEATLLDELMRIAEQNPSFSVVPFCSSERGHISADALQTMDTDLFSKDIFICGPPPMMTSLKQQLIKKGVRSSHIHTEEFTFR